MNIAAVMAMVSKGLTIIEVLREGGKDIIPAVAALKDFVGSNGGNPTQADQDKCEAILDAALAEFNEPLPPE